MLAGHDNVVETVRLVEMPRRKTAGRFMKETFVDSEKAPRVRQTEDDRLVLYCKVTELFEPAVTLWMPITGD